MKKITALILSAVFIMLGVSGVSARFVDVPHSADATVVAVLDGNAIEVRLDNGDFALVRLVGVETDSPNEAREWLTREILGARVRLEAEPAVARVGRWNAMYVLQGGELVNAKLVQNGHGRLTSELPVLSRRHALTYAENFARNAEVGVWFVPPPITPEIAYHDRVNINTATAAFMHEHLDDISIVLASRIISFRNDNPFREVTDLKFVNGITREIFDGIRHRLTVSTNINSASRFEIMSLGDMPEENADRIIEFRAREIIEEWGDLAEMFHGHGQWWWWRDVWTVISPFVTLGDYDAVIGSRPNFTVNINTATRARLTEAGLSGAHADIIITQRNMYHIKSLSELSNVANLGFTEDRINRLADNLTTITDINSATEHEIRSLLNVWGGNADIIAIMQHRPFTNMEQLRSRISESAFTAMQPYISFGRQYTDFVNINTATTAQLTSVGFTHAEAAAIVSQRRNMLRPADIPAAARLNDRRVTISTNINMAGRFELETLGTFMTETVIRDIMSYRSDQPFGSRAEIQTFFTERGMLGEFRQIERFIAVR